MRLAAVLLMLTSFSAIAQCPQLQGLYRVCKSTNGEQNKLRIKQVEKDGATVYTISWSTERMQIHTADGQTRVTPIFDTGLALHSMALCQDDVLHRTLSTVKDDGQVTMTMEQKYFMEGGVLRFTAEDENGIYRDITCKK